jgi:hypothetical protein
MKAKTSRFRHSFDLVAHLRLPLSQVLTTVGKAVPVQARTVFVGRAAARAEHASNGSPWYTDAGAAMMLLMMAAVDEGMAAAFVGGAKPICCMSFWESRRITSPLVSPCSGMRPRTPDSLAT